jgi:hypothetical protein
VPIRWAASAIVRQEAVVRNRSKRLGPQKDLMAAASGSGSVGGAGVRAEMSVGLAQ